MIPRRLLAALLLSSCAAPVPEPRTSVNEPSHEIEYTVALALHPELQVCFSLSAAAAEDGATTLAVDESWGGVEHAADSLLDVRATGSTGQELRVERTSSHEWQVSSDPGERLAISWRVGANDFRTDPDPHGHYRTLLDASILQFLGHLALLVPAHADGSKPRDVALRWKGFAEAHWAVASSFGSDPHGFETTASLDEIRHAVYLAGPDLRVVRKPFRGKELGVAIAGRSWTFRDEDFVEVVRSILDAECAFFADHEFPSFFVSLIPVGQPDPKSRSLGGTGLTRSFALFLQPDTLLGTRAGGGLDVPHLLAHEMFHHWNGGVAQMEESEQLVYWFSEGFTDFYARRILHRTGYGGLEETARSLNETLKEYALSPARAAPNEKIREGFWKDRDVGKLPYLRGNLVAVLLDDAIRTRSHGARSLDDFVREVVAAGRKGEKLSTDSLLQRIAAWTDEAFASEVRSIVVDGAPVVLEPSIFAPCLALETESHGAYDLGFDFEASRAAKEIRGVRAGSAAERAGLRDGLRLTRVNLVFGNPDVPVEIGVRDGDADRTIRWLPQGDPVPVQQVRVPEKIVETDCAWL
jgi:predicted metalloprotease with PDZ domain